MNLNNPLHSCFEKPSNKTKVTKKCLDELSLFYKYIKPLGAGITALTIRISNNQHDLAIKMMKAGAAAYKEVDVSCKVNSMVNYSPVFNTTHGWTICKGIPKEWASRIKDKDYGDAEKLKEAIEKNQKILFLALELNTHKIDEVGLNENDIMLSCFLLLHGIAVARKYFPYFRHRDIHMGNVMIMLRTVKNSVIKALPDITVKLPSDESVVFTLPDVVYLPKLIDFGESRFQQKGHTDDVPEESYQSFEDIENTKFAPRNDIRRLKDLILKLLQQRQIEDSEIDSFFTSCDYKEAINAERNDYMIIEALLKNPIFERYNILSNVNFERKKKKSCWGMFCQVCASPNPKKTYDTNPHYAFCDDVCEQKYKTFRQFIPYTGEEVYE